jgi:hypothetical protein
VVLVGRLLHEHVERRAGDPLFLQRVGQRELVDHLAAGVVDDEQVRACNVEQPFAVQQVLGPLAAGDVERDHVELARNSSKSRTIFTLPSRALSAGK